MALIELNKVTKIYNDTAVAVQALKDVDIKIKKEEFTAIVGPSGSGKTTLLNIIGGLDKPTSGNIVINETDISTFKTDQMIDFRLHNIGFVFQAYNLIPVFTAKENVEFIMLLQGVEKEERERNAVELLTAVDLSDRINSKPTELSGGQQQRVAVARALANTPAIVLADEPTGNLDLTTGEDIINLLKELSVERGVTVISATHDYKMLNVSDRVIWIRDGRVDKIEDREELSISIGQIGSRE